MDNLADKNPGNISGVTPLHDAAGNGHVEVCKWFLENVFEILPEDDDGLTPYDFADMNAHEEIRKLFD